MYTLVDWSLCWFYGITVKGMKKNDCKCFALGSLELYNGVRKGSQTITIYLGVVVNVDTGINTVGKQTLCKLSFEYTSQVKLTVRTDPKIG